MTRSRAAPFTLMVLMILAFVVISPLRTAYAHPTKDAAVRITANQMHSSTSDVVWSESCIGYVPDTPASRLMAEVVWMTKPPNAIVEFKAVTMEKSGQGPAGIMGVATNPAAMNTDASGWQTLARSTSPIAEIWVKSWTPATAHYQLTSRQTLRC